MGDSVCVFNHTRREYLNGDRPYRLWTPGDGYLDLERVTMWLLAPYGASSVDWMGRWHEREGCMLEVVNDASGGNETYYELVYGHLDHPSPYVDVTVPAVSAWLAYLAEVERELPSWSADWFAQHSDS